LSNFSKNLKSLRKKAELTQSQLSEKLGLNRATLASYEEGRAEPKFEILMKLASFLKVSIDDLLMGSVLKKPSDAWSPKDLQILPIVVDGNDQERISLVSQKAKAGYMAGMQDREYIEELPSFALPFDKLSQGTYRAFEIEGDSMLPIPSGSFIIARFEDDWKAIKSGSPYIVVSESDGLSYKRVEFDFRKETIELRSDNQGYEPYTLSLFDVKELWKAVGYISFELNEKPIAQKNIGELNKLFIQLKKEVEELKSSK
jgi:transcriptional regulator with XRE-family HTH domain